MQNDILQNSRPIKTVIPIGRKVKTIMAKSKRLPEIFDLARVLRDGYRQRYDAAVRERDNKIQYARDNYMVKSPLLKEALKEARMEFDRKIETLKTETRQALTDEVDKLRASEEAKLLMSPTSIENFAHLNDIPLTATELRIICERHGGENYYVDRFFRTVAEKNGIDVSGFPLMTDIDSKLDALQNLSDGLDDLLIKYDENKTLAGFNALSDRLIAQAESKYIGTERTALTVAQKVTRAFQAIQAQPDQISKALCISNQLRNCTDKASRDALLVKLAENPVGDLAEHLSAPSAIQAFRDGKAKEYHQAEDALSQLVSAGQAGKWDTVHDILTAHKDNEFFRDMSKDVLRASDKGSEIAQTVNRDAGQAVYDVY